MTDPQTAESILMAVEKTESAVNTIASGNFFTALLL